MRAKTSSAIAILLIAAIVGAKPAGAQNASAASIVDQLKAQYKLAKRGANRVDPGIVLVVQQGGITGVPLENSTAPAATFKDGLLRSSSGGSASTDSRARALSVGEKVYVTKIDANMTNDTVTFTILGCDSCNGARQGSSYKSMVVFQFSRGYLATAKAEQIGDAVEQVLAMDVGPNMPSSAVSESRAAQSSQPAEADSQSASEGQAFTNDDVIKLVQAKLPDAIVLEKIRSSVCAFDLRTDALIKLKRAGVSDAILQAMVQAMKSPAPAAEAAAAPAAPVADGGPDCGDYSSCLKAGITAFQAGQWDQALAYFQKAASLQPGNPVIWGNIAAVFIGTGQYQLATEAADKALSVGGPLTIVACHERALQPCEPGILSLGPKEISFTNANGQRLFAAPPGQVAAKGAFNAPGQWHAYFRVQVGGKNYNFDPNTVGVSCQLGYYFQCPEQGIEQQWMIANYVTQVIQRLASGTN
jgi:tetratricopeptide (TPR) repeat protein